MTILKVTLPNGECGTVFCIQWKGQLCLATCDQVFLSLGTAAVMNEKLTLSDGQHPVNIDCKIRRHATADVALALPQTTLPFPLTAFPILRSTTNQVRDGMHVIVEGFQPLAQTLTTQHGSTRDQYHGTKTLKNPIAGTRTYEGHLIPNSLLGLPGLSGSPIRTEKENGVIAVYSCSGHSRALTEGFHSGHLEEIL